MLTGTHRVTAYLRRAKKETMVIFVKTHPISCDTIALTRYDRILFPLQYGHDDHLQNR